MRIAHIVRSLDPAGGGPPIVVTRLAAEMARQGHDVRIISHPTPDAQKRIDDMVGSAPIRRETVPAPDRFQRILGGGSAALESLLQEADIIHLHGVWDWILKAAATAAHKLNVPCVIAPHGMLDPWSLSQKSAKKKLALLLGYRRMLNQAAFLHLLNRDEQNLIAPLRLTCPMHVIPNGIAPDEFTKLPAPGTFRAAHPELGDARYILFLSRLHYKKGLDILADAFAILAKSDSQIRLVIAGPDDGAKLDFQSRIHSAGLDHRAHLVGPIFGQDKLAALADASCFALPSRQEGFSIAILEAMACGLPVVITDACHFPEVAEQNAGEVTGLDATAFAAALSLVLANPKPYGEAGRELALSRFTWPQVAGQLIASYQRHQARQHRR